jgi:uncharacterized protein YbcI
MPLSPQTTMADVQTISAPAPGSAHEAITNELVALHKGTCGKGPSNARVHVGADVVVCVMRDGLTRLEQTLVEEGHADAVAEQRRLLHAAMRDRAVEIVQEALGRRVVSFMPASDSAMGIESFVFVLEGTSEN